MKHFLFWESASNSHFENEKNAITKNENKQFQKIWRKLFRRTLLILMLSLLPVDQIWRMIGVETCKMKAKITKSININFTNNGINLETIENGS